jgi:Tat protein secretion system quality control protein TatD with DNase activity
MINNNHKYYLWSNVRSCFSKNTKIYNTYGIHPKYIPENNISFHLDKLEEIILKEKESRHIVAIGECGIDETSRFPFEVQLNVFEAQVTLANKFHLPLILHGRGLRAYENMYSVLEKQLNINNPVQWHCVNSNSNLLVLNNFINKFTNSFLSFNASSIFDKDAEKQKSFQHWLKKHDDFLNKIIFETDFPYLKPIDLNDTEYNPLSGIFRTAIFFVDILRQRGLHATKLVQISNWNIRRLFNID